MNAGGQECREPKLVPGGFLGSTDNILFLLNVDALYVSDLIFEALVVDDGLPVLEEFFIFSLKMKLLIDALDDALNTSLDRLA